MSSDDEIKTPLGCRACVGNYILGKDATGKDIVCRWCTEGRMDAEQFHTWRRFKSGSRPAVPAAKSTLEFDPHRVVILERFERAWAKAQKTAPGMRFGHFVLEALAYQHMAPQTLASLTDERLAEILEHYVLFGGGG